MSFLVRIKRSRDETPRRSILVSPPLKKRPCLNDVRLLEYFDSIEDGEQLAGVVQKSLALGHSGAPKTVLDVPASYEERIYETTKREEVRGALLKFKDQHSQTKRHVVEVNDEKVVVVDLERKRLGDPLEVDSKRMRKRSREEQFVYDVYRVSTSFDVATGAYSKEHMLADHVLDLLRNDDEIMFAELNANESLFYSGGLTSDSEPYEDESLHTQSDYPEASSSHETFDVDEDQMDYTSEIPDSGSDNDKWRVRDFLDGIDKAPVELDVLTSEDSDVFGEDPFALQYHSSAPAFPEASARVRNELVERHLDDPDDWMSRLMALEKAEDEWESKRKEKAVKSQDEVRMQIPLDLRRDLVDRNVFVFHIPDTWTEGNLQEVFRPFGLILACTVVRQPDMTSKGYGFVCFQSKKDARAAVAKMNGLVVGPKRLKVSLKKTPEACQKAQIQQLVRLSHNEELVDSVRDCTLFVFYLPSSWDDLRLSDEFSRCGRVTQCRVARGVGGCSMGYGFVTMEMAAGAARAMAMLNGLAVEESKRLKVSLKRRPAPVHGPHTVFVFHLPSWWGEEDLESAFSHVGSVSAAVMPRDAENRPQGYGFVSFSTEQSALLAVRSMDKTAVPDSYKRLHVSLKKKCLS